MTEREEALAEDTMVDLMWAEVEPDLEDIVTYGGAFYETEECVARRLADLAEYVRRGDVSAGARMQLRDRVLEYIDGPTTAMDDSLYDIVYATCYDDADLRDLAAELEVMGDWAATQAMRTYREIGDEEDYLRLRRSRLEYGDDYHDLATFHWERGECRRAVEVARRGLGEGEGAMSRLRSFLADRAREEGDRGSYLELNLREVTDGRLSVAGYRRMREVCTDEEWAEYEPRLLALLPDLPPVDRMEIHLERGEHDRVVQMLAQEQYSPGEFGGGRWERAAEILRDSYPEEVLAFYESGLREMGTAAPRGRYAQWARVLGKVREMLVQVLGDADRWEELGRRVKYENMNKPAFQEEFAARIPDWDSL